MVIDRFGALVALLALCGAACTSEFDPTARYECTSDADCVSGFYCHPAQDECVPDSVPAGAVFYGLCDDADCATSTVDRLEISRAGEAVEARSVVSLLDGADAPTGSEQWIAPSPSGAWLLLGTTRECAVQLCMALVAADGSGFTPITLNAQPLQADSGVVDDAAATVVFEANNAETGAAGLFRIDQGPLGWQAAGDLGSAEACSDYQQLVLAQDGCRLAFRCIAPSGGVSLAQITLDKAGCPSSEPGVEALVTTDAPPACSDCATTGAISHPAFARDGSLVFEADWTGARTVWRRSVDGVVAPVNPALTHDTLPCALPDGRIVSRFGQQTNGASFGLKIMAPDGTSVETLLPPPAGPGVADSRLLCSG